MSCPCCRQIPGLHRPPEQTIQGKKITLEEALAGLPPKKDWAKLKAKVMKEFKRKPKKIK